MSKLIRATHDCNAFSVYASVKRLNLHFKENVLNSIIQYFKLLMFLFSVNLSCCVGPG